MLFFSWSTDSQVILLQRRYRNMIMNDHLLGKEMLVNDCHVFNIKKKKNDFTYVEPEQVNLKEMKNRIVVIRSWGKINC